MPSRRILYFAMLLFLCTPGMSSCSDDEPVQEMVIPDENQDDNGNNGENNENNNNEDTMTSNKLNIQVGGRIFTATLSDNETAQVFKKLLPLNITMSELNGNEKYCYLSEGLPTASRNPGTIEAGDLMLYGSSCVVLFYETFRTSYSYTRIGKIDNPAGLAEVVGSGNVKVTFELQD